jgi:hypothetical protein
MGRVRFYGGEPPASLFAKGVLVQPPGILTRIRRRLKNVAMRWVLRPLYLRLFVCLRLISDWWDGTDVPFLEGMENRVYADAYRSLRGKSFAARMRWMDRHRDLLHDTLGVERAERMLSRLERRIQWEQAAQPRPTDAPLAPSRAEKT